MPRNPLALLLLALLPLCLAGCLLDFPLTSPHAVTSPNIDTRLLGVFEFREPPPGKPKPGVVLKPEDYSIQRIAVLPLDANHYVIYYRDFSKKPAETSKFLGWISRVDSRYYLSFEDQTTGSSTLGKYGFFKFEWQFPGNFLLYAPDLKDSDHAHSPYEVRRSLRNKLKAGTAFPYEATTWQRIARIWWDPAGAQSGATIPKEFETGTKLENPGL
ncbi:MAG: hypothetical protein PHC88_01935 [Terrimicrobiaceae bacterium]|nr:hypothetical protein [Terrimicrobiaceae bacterium]